MKDRTIINNITSAWTGHRDFAIWLVERVHPEVTVDLGVDYGYSLFSFAMPEIGTVYGIDSFQGDAHAGERTDTYEYVTQFQREHEFANVKLVRGWFSDIAQIWRDPIDILHIDGLHTYEAVEQDWNNWSPLVRDNGVILLHDVCSYPDVTEFFNKITWPKMHFTHSHGLGVVSKNAKLMDEILNTQFTVETLL